MSLIRLFYFLVRIINSYQQEHLWSQVWSCGRPSTPVLWVLVLKAFPFILVINLNNSKIFTKNICAFGWGSCPENGGRHLRMYQTGPRIRILFCLFSKHTASLEFSLLASMCLLIYIFLFYFILLQFIFCGLCCSFNLRLYFWSRNTLSLMTKKNTKHYMNKLPLQCDCCKSSQLLLLTS